MEHPDSLPDGEPWPTLAVIVPIRNEAPHLEAALRSLVIQDYPRLRIIAINDRSEDATLQILGKLAREYRHLQVETIESLPADWLGKPHALWRGVQLAGDPDWILFTDADVIHAPSALRRAVAFAWRRKLDLLSLYPEMILQGYWERALTSCFALLSFFGYAPWRVNMRESGAYFAIGAFILVRRTKYDEAGGHQALAREVVDDARLCRLIKRHDGVVRIVIGQGVVRIRWQEGVRGFVDGLTKNVFAAVHYSLALTLGACVFLFLVSVIPFLGWLFLPHAVGVLSLLALLAILGAHQIASRGTGIGLPYAAGHPIAALIMIWILLRSAFKTLYNRGITWRGTYYPLDHLKVK